MAIDWGDAERGIQTAVAADAQEFIDALRRSNPHWWEDESCPWVFRGHAQADWPLLPSAWRTGNPIIENATLEATRRFEAVAPNQELKWMWGNFVSGVAEFGSNDQELGKRLTIATTTEYLPLWEFTARCDALGMPVPLMGGPGPDPDQDPDWLADAQIPLVGDELLRFSDLPNALALAQHHGLPTRLLDWTSDPIASAFFAVEALEEPEAEHNLVVWALHKRRARDTTTEGMTFPNGLQGAGPVTPRITVFRPLSRDNPYLAAQSGLFTTIAASGGYYLKHNGERPSLETFVRNANPAQPVLRRLLLSHEHAPDLINILQRERVSRSALMPTMDNVAADVLRKWRQFKLVDP